MIIQNQRMLEQVIIYLQHQRFYQHNLVIDDFEDNSSAFQESSLIIIFSNFQINNFIVSIKNIKVQENKLLNMLQNFLFKLHSHQITIQNTQFLNLQNLAMFYLIEINQIIFDCVVFENSQQKYKVPISQLCTEQTRFRNQLLYVLGFQQSSMSNIKIANLFSINYSLMDLNYSLQFILDLIGQIILVNVQFIGNIILQNKQITSSLVTIESKYNLNIKLFRFLRYQNSQIILLSECLNQFDQSFITITSYLIEISNLIYMNSNLLSQTLWQQYYDFQLDDQYYQQEINSIIHQGISYCSFNFSLYGKCFLRNCAAKSFIFQIQTQGSGKIKISNANIDSVYTNLKDSENSGSIYIDSSSSLLNVELNKILFCYLILKQKLHFLNEYMLAKFSSQIMKQSQVSINNLSIYSIEELWIYFFSMIGQITLLELENLYREDNVMIFLKIVKFKYKIQRLKEQLFLLFQNFKAFQNQNFLIVSQPQFKNYIHLISYKQPYPKKQNQQFLLKNQRQFRVKHINKKWIEFLIYQI
ncbi:unnamed protein product [Paramecium sonneborni]|uniref:Uncharacterized protein n=1 Tax=Paramecium sonneborni TaxID=65129 RepID=A0A8S1R6B0_9CILI|nr:unnamed protein product [Paramecium sonneborni]